MPGKIDFSRLRAGLSSDTAKSPRELFDLLPSKASRYSYLRDVQAEVLDRWAHKRTARDLTIKMNTGSGKTVVGLLILKSCLNEAIFPAVYVAPSPHLVGQVIREARELGLEVTESADDLRFRSGKAILVVNVHKLINGLSVFGVGDTGIKIPIGSIVIDDAHACLDTAEERFTLRLRGGLFADLLAIFENDLEQQSESGLMDLKASDPHKTMLVPFWAWIAKQERVQTALRAHQWDDDVKFTLPLLKDHLHLCRCAFGAGEVEIAPRCLPISMIPAFGAAQRRIFMSATFRDDSVLVTHFDADPSSLRDIISPTSGGDIGDRMILVPQEANPSLNDDQLKAMFKDLAQKWNVVVLVPSDFRAGFWKDVAQQTLTAKNLAPGVEALQRGHVGLVVLVNKYDGIDLPNDACRILVIDGLPDVRGKIDRIDQSALAGTDTTAARGVQRIEQGMGRGVRSKDDFCAVFLMGRSLTSALYARGALDFLTPATRAQLELSNQMSAQLRGADVSVFKDAVETFLARDVAWMTASRAAVVGAEYRTTAAFSDTALHERRAFNAAVIGDFQAGVHEMQAAVNAEADRRVKAWLKIEMAEYQHRLDASEAQQIVKSAVAVNNQLLRPLDGIQYVRMGDAPDDQASTCLDHLRATYSDPNKLVLDLNGALEALVFAPDTAPLFERTLAELAPIIGFRGSRPEEETGRGPDVLWALGTAQYLVIECKNGATTNTVNKHDCNQLTGSMQWFADKYGPSCAVTPILVHPARVAEYAATPHPNARIIIEVKLDEFRQAIRDYVTAVAQLPRFGTRDDIVRLLTHHGLRRGDLVAQFTVTFQPR